MCVVVSSSDRSTIRHSEVPNNDDLSNVR